MNRSLPINHDETEQVFQCAIEKGARAILLTSSLPDEGTSTVAYALAQRLAVGGGRVLLVDFHAASSFAENALALERGVWELQSQGVSGEPFTVSGKSLSILAAPLGGFQGMACRDEAVVRQAVGHWMRQFDYVVGDAPPLAPSERGGIPTEILARVFDTVLLVMLADATPRAALQSAIRRIGEAHGKIAGVVINDREMPSLRDELTRQVRKLGKRFEPLAMLLDRTFVRLGLMSVDY